MAERRRWEHQEGEGAKALEAFECYRMLGPDRSLQAAWERYYTRPGTLRARQRRGKEEAGQFPGYWGAWATKWGWTERAAAWDEEVAALARDQELDRELKARMAEQEEEQRQRRLRREEARAARAVGRRGLLRILQEIEGQQLDSMKLAELIPHLRRFLDAVTEGQRLERLEMGEPTEITQQVSQALASRLADVIRRYVPPEQWETVAAEMDQVLDPQGYTGG